MSVSKNFNDDNFLLNLAKTIPTPFYLYDEQGIIENAENFKKAFSWAPNFINYFAVKALPNPSIIKLLSSIGFGCDCSSLPELLLSEKAGVKGEKIMFSSNDTPKAEFDKALSMGAIINLDDETHLDFLDKMPEVISFRYNPGPDRTGNVIIGNPVEAKYGVPTDRICECYKKAQKKGAKRFMLHTMVASNELDLNYIAETARMLFNLVVKIYDETGVKIEGIDMGGGIGIPYKEDQKAMDINLLSQKIKELYDEIIVPSPIETLNISFECGRFITGPYGKLVSKVLHVTHKYKDYVGLDACMANLMRPALYGAYHRIDVLGKGKKKKDRKYDVTGSLCENNDKFAIDRMLPEIKEGDILTIADSGAHGHSMGFNYNGKLRSAEYLLLKDGMTKMIRRAERYEDYIATVVF